MIASIILTILGTIAMAIATAVGAEITGNGSVDDIDRTDERDISISRRGDVVGYYVASAGAVVALILTMLEYDYFWIANTLYLSFAVAGAGRGDREAARVPPGVLMVRPTRVTNRIRVLRFAAGEMTQAELADRVGVTRQTIIAIEQGRYSPSLEVAFRIAHALSAPLDEVFGYPQEES